MIARQGTWAEVHKGMVVQDPQGQAWLIDDEKDGWLRYHMVANPVYGAASRVADMHWRPVTILEPTEDEALAALAGALGAAPVAEVDHATGVARCDVFTAAEGSKKKGTADHSGHLFLVHGIDTSGKHMVSQAALREAHDASHENPDPLYVRPHWHGPKQ